MHIPDGILPATVCVAGYATTSALTWYSLRHIKQQENPQAGIPKAAMLAVAFFVASWIHIPVPPVSVHLILNGLLGVILGYYAFPAILVGLFFQAVMFQHGGLTTLGINATMMGLPALLAYHLFQMRHFFGTDNRTTLGIWSALSGATGLGLAVLIFYGLLVTHIPATLDAATEQAAITALVVAHIPLMLLEGGFTAMLVLFLHRVQPALLGLEHPPQRSALGSTAAPELEQA